MPNISHYFPITDPTMIFFVVLIIILFAPIVMSKLRIPHIIGMVLAGTLIGKYGLNILERDSSFELFGKVGVLYIMFLAGLEMNIDNIKKHYIKFIVFGLLTFIVPFVISYFVGIYLLSYSPMTSMLLACILSSNTLIAYPIVCKYGLQKHISVQMGVGASMISLILALLVLAAIVGAVKGEVNLTFVVLFIAKVAFFCISAIIFIPKVTRWFFNRYADAVMLYIYVLSIMFLSAIISEVCGLEGIFGAFVAGLILNRFIPGVSPLMNRIEFIGNALFIPYFLIGVGMLINTRTLLEGNTILWIVMCMVIFGTFGKAVAAYLSCISFHFPLKFGHMMFGLTEAHAAGGIAMTMVGMKLIMPDGSTLVDTNMLNGVVIMILFTCIISSIVVENSARSILLKEKLHPEDLEKKGDDEKIMLPIQHSEDADNLIHMAILMRNKRLNRGLIGLNVVYDDINSSRNINTAQRLLHHAVATASSADVRMQTQSRLATNIANGIKHAFKEFDASEIIMGLHRKRSDSDSFWGAYTQNLIMDIHQQIMICRINRPLNTLRRIQVVIPSRVEFEPGFYRWVERLARLAGNLGCRIIFHGRTETTALISQYINNRHPEVRAEYILLQHWKDIISLSKEVNDDHMLAIITARKGTVSYKPAFEHLPQEINNYFPTCSLMILYPDQNGQPQDVMTFTSPQNYTEDSAYTALIKWWNKTFKKSI